MATTAMPPINSITACESAVSSAAPLCILPAELGLFHLCAVAVAGVKYHQLRLTLQPGGELLAILAAQLRHTFAGWLTCAIEQRRHNQQGRQHDTAERQREGDVEQT